MKIEELSKIRVLDGHIHYPDYRMMDGLIAITDKLNIDQFNIVCTPHLDRLSLIPDAMHLKSNYPERVYVFGGLNISAYFMAPEKVGELFAKDIEMLTMIGCDGIKIIEGKPLMRKMLPVPPFDSDAFSPFWEKAAQVQIPIVFHVNDPEEFWDEAKAPSWAKEQGWFYGDGSFVNNEAQYTEILNVMERNPTLKIIFAHFYFMSAQLQRLADLLDRFPNMYVDLTPGIEMYHNFSGAIDAARDFFIKYQDRIIFGTDIGAKALLVNPEEGVDFNESYERVSVVRNFLESEDPFYLNPKGGFLFGDPSIPFKGLGLPADVLEKIYHRNFENAVGGQPKPVNKQGVIGFCGQLEEVIKIQGSSQPGKPGDPSAAQFVRSYFEAHS